MQYELGMPHFKWYWRLQQSCSNQSSCLFWKLRDASPLHFKWTQSDERCTFEKYLFCILGGGGESIFLCLSLIKKAKTRICLYTENRLKKHLVCSMNRRNDYIKSTLKWVDFASLKGFVSDRVGKKDDLAGFKLSTVSAHTVWSIRLCPIEFLPEHALFVLTVFPECASACLFTAHTPVISQCNHYWHI